MLERLEDQISWYDRRSLANQARFKQIKTIEILAAACIPLIAGVDASAARWATGGLGALIAVLEGALQLNQYQQNWTSYRATCESLKHEKYLYLAKAAHYASAHDARILLAERVESLVSQEHAKWASAQQQEAKEKT